MKYVHTDVKQSLKIPANRIDGMVPQFVWNYSNMYEMIIVFLLLQILYIYYMVILYIVIVPPTVRNLVWVL